MEIKRIYLVVGDLVENWTQPEYSTDCRRYELDVYESEPTEDDLRKIRAFRNSKDALGFAWSCNMVGVTTAVLDWDGAEWKRNPTESDTFSEKVAEY